MATITLTSLYANLHNWPGMLFEAPAGTTILTQTATTFIARYPASGVDFPNYRVEVTGTGFAYLGGEPVAGTMSRVRVLDGSGNVVISFSGLGSNPLAGDFSQFFTSVFGSYRADDNGIRPELMIAWSHLMAGHDTITGTNGDDNQGLVGFDAGNDVYNMLDGNDWMFAGLGNDTYNGGAGFDVLSFDETNYIQGAVATRGATINVQTGVVLDPWGGTDRVSLIEEFRGSRLGDSFIGSNTERDRFMGLRGRDIIDGGANSFDAGGAMTEDRRDEARYDRDLRDGGRLGIVVDLETSFVGGSVRGTIRDGFGHMDTVIDIERVVGTRFNDTFVGSRMDNVFRGGEGRDSYRGEAGFDAVDFGRYFGASGPTSGIRVNLTLTSGQIQNDGFGNVENATSIEAIWGTGLGDSVRGGAASEEMYLSTGRDTMTGGGGSDTFVWENRLEFGQGDVVTDFSATGPGADTLAFYTPDIAGMTTTLRLVNGTAATTAQATFIYNAVNDTLFWDPDGTGAAAALAIVRLTNVAALSSANFDLWT